MDRAHELVAGARRVVVLTGAGISTDSGIPDFRGPNGLWTKNPGAEKTATLATYLAEPDVRRRAWQNRLASPMWQASPNRGHEALVVFERSGRLDLLITQNIDGLHQRAGSSPSIVVEIHGTVHDVECLSCGDRNPMAPTLERVAGGEEDPACLVCGGILKSATISFGQQLVGADLERAEEAALGCDLFLAVGTTLTVHPVAGLAPLAKQSGAALVIVNAEPTPFDAVADAVVRDRIAEALPYVLGVDAEGIDGPAR